MTRVRRLGLRDTRKFRGSLNKFQHLRRAVTSYGALSLTPLMRVSPLLSRKTLEQAIHAKAQLHPIRALFPIESRVSRIYGGFDRSRPIVARPPIRKLAPTGMWFSACTNRVLETVFKRWMLRRGHR